MRLSALVERLGGVLHGIDRDVDQVATLDQASARQISFLSNPRYRNQVRTSRAGALIGPADVVGDFSGSVIVAANPYAYFARVAQLLNPVPAVQAARHPTAVIDPTAQVSPSAVIGAHAVLAAGVVVAEGAVIGPGCVLEQGSGVGADTRLVAQVYLGRDCRIGARGLVHAGAVIGADGFGFAQDQGVWVKIPQIGRALIGDDVEIGAGTTIDRGALADTIIGDGVKLDNQIQIGHNVVVGPGTAMAGCVGVAGSARIGARCTFGGGAIVLGHLEIADEVHVSAGTVITKSIRSPGQYTGLMPFAEHAEWRRDTVFLRHLERMNQRIKQLEEQVAQQRDELGEKR